MNVPLLIARATTVEQVVATLREAILQGRIRPGEPLRESLLAAEWKIARGTIREAMRMLAAEGVIRYDQNRGFSVPRLDPEDVHDLYLARRTIELAALGNLDAVQTAIPGLEAALREMRTAAHVTDWFALNNADQHFHSALVASLGSRRLSAAFAGLWKELQLALVLLDNRTGGAADLVRSHKVLIQAVQVNNARGARIAWNQHLLDSERVLLSGMPSEHAR